MGLEIGYGDKSDAWSPKATTRGGVETLTSTLEGLGTRVPNPRGAGQLRSIASAAPAPGRVRKIPTC